MDDLTRHFREGSEFCRAWRPSKNKRRAPAEKNDLPADVSLGQCFIIDLDKIVSCDVASGHRRRPAFIWGIYRNNRGDVKAVDLLHSRTPKSDGKDYPEDLLIDEELSARVGLRTRPIKIPMNRLHTVKYSGDSIIRYTGEKVDPALFPDLVVRRLYALCFNLKLEHDTKVNIDPAWEREGFFFDHLSQDNIRSGLVVPEVGFDCRRKYYDDGVLDRAMVNDLADWAVAYCSSGNGAHYPSAMSFETWPALDLEKGRRNIPVYRQDNGPAAAPM